MSERQIHKKKKQKRTIVSKIEIKLHFPYVVPTQHEHRQQLMPIYNTTVHKNKINVTLIVDICWVL